MFRPQPLADPYRPVMHHGRLTTDWDFPSCWLGICITVHYVLLHTSPGSMPPKPAGSSRRGLHAGCICICRVCVCCTPCCSFTNGSSFSGSILLFQPPLCRYSRLSPQCRVQGGFLMLRPHLPNLRTYLSAGCSKVPMGVGCFCPATSHAACRSDLSRLPDFQSSGPLQDSRPRHGVVSDIPTVIFNLG